MPRDQSTLTRVFRLFSSSFFFFFFLVIFFLYVCVCVGSIIYTAATSFQLASFLSSSTHVDIQDTQTHVITCVEKSSIVSPVSFIGFQIRLMSTSNEKKNFCFLEENHFSLLNKDETRQSILELFLLLACLSTTDRHTPLDY